MQLSQELGTANNFVTNASDIGISDKAFEQIAELTNINNLPTHIRIRPYDSQHTLEIARLILPTLEHPPTTIATHPTKRLFELFITTELLNKVGSILGEGALHIRRASINFMREGDAIGWHRDTEQDPDLEKVAILCIKKAAIGGEHVVYSENGDQHIDLMPGQLLLSNPNNLHSVKKVQRGERITLVVWFSKYNGPLRKPSHC